MTGGLLLQAAHADALLPGDSAKGKKLVESKCAACHAQMFGGDSSKIFTRQNRRVKSVEGLVGQVQACNEQLNANLSRDDINDIVIHLNETYYKF